MIDLYTWHTPNGRKVSIMLEEIGMDYNVFPINIAKDEQFQPHFLGMKWDEMAPSLPFVFGSQNDIRIRAASSGWLTVDSTLNTMYNQNKSTNLTLRSTVEPFKQFRVE